MPTIRPVSDLRNNYTEIEKILQSEKVFLTKNGVGTSVIMSMEEYDKIQDTLFLMTKIAEADYSMTSGDNGENIDVVFKRLKEHIYEKNKNIENS